MRSFISQNIVGGFDDKDFSKFKNELINDYKSNKSNAQQMGIDYSGKKSVDYLMKSALKSDMTDLYIASFKDLNLFEDVSYNLLKIFNKIFSDLLMMIYLLYIKVVM
jgi:hypothetical protein